MNPFQFASVSEVAQLLLAFAGLSLAFWGVWSAGEDAVNLSESPPGDLRRLIALGNLRGQIARVSAQGVLLIVGVVSVLMPPPYNLVTDSRPEMLQSFIVRMGLIVVTGILVADSYFERRQRMMFLSRVRGNHATEMATERHDEVMSHVDAGAKASAAAEAEANQVNQKIKELREDLLRVEQQTKKTDDKVDAS